MARLESLPRSAHIQVSVLARGGEGGDARLSPCEEGIRETWKAERDLGEARLVDGGEEPSENSGYPERVGEHRHEQLLVAHCLCVFVFVKPRQGAQGEGSRVGHPKALLVRTNGKESPDRLGLRVRGKEGTPCKVSTRPNFCLPDPGPSPARSKLPTRTATETNSSPTSEAHWSKS